MTTSPQKRFQQVPSNISKLQKLIDNNFFRDVADQVSLEMAYMLTLKDNAEPTRYFHMIEGARMYRDILMRFAEPVLVTPPQDSTVNLNWNK